jgi:hypothetical protein
MLYDLLTILLIIGFSFLFKISITKSYDEQLIFILLALIIMVIYKYLTYRHMMRNNSLNKPETFTGTGIAEQLAAFVEQDIPTGVNQANINTYSSMIKELQDRVDIMNQYLRDLTETASENKNNTPAFGGLDFQAGQQIQDFQINKIRSDIQRTADLIKQNRLLEDAKKYNKIKVFSSCVVAGADGGLQQDTPSTGQRTQGASSSSQATPAGMMATSSGSSSSAVAAPLASGSTIGAGSGVNLQSVLNSIATTGINVNIN